MSQNNFKNGRELYESLLARRNENLSEFQRAVDFFVLNRITFSGVVDSGGYSQKAYESRFTQSSIDRLKNMDKILKTFTFSNEGYENLLQREGQGVFIFLDPPYFKATKSRLYGKRGDLHTSFNHEKLCENLKNTKHHFLLTYDDSEFIRELYKDFYIKEFSVQYGMNNFKQTRAEKGQELLISNREFVKKDTLFSA
ncbi:DNA adenine methylase [Campylobacter troglodytis]|uniref:DNA adenine methylase n=1 Tax=Campylobacter troglodytis TaxID=654363 RepID=UPI00163D03C3|nr:DNA adenine methylase [Campylobacter troglodytis]